MTEDSFLGSRDDHEDLIDIEGLDDVRYAVKIENASRIYKIGSREIVALDNISLDI